MFFPFHVSTGQKATPMRACIQRVSRAQVRVGGQPCARIGQGMLVLLGVAQDDTEADVRLLAEKIAGLRIFEDPAGKMNLALADVGGSVLVVSQFTLLAQCWNGRRPSFTEAAPPEKAQQLYELFVQTLAGQGIPVQTGRFRENMEVELVNDGPVTFLVQTRRGQPDRD